MQASRVRSAKTPANLVACEPMLRINCDFDAGNIEVRGLEQDGRARLAIRQDKDSEHYQWFYFRVTGAAGTPLSLVLENAGKASYPPGWEDYRAVYSYDRETWLRADTSYADGCLLYTSPSPRD